MDKSSDITISDDDNQDNLITNPVYHDYIDVFTNYDNMKKNNKSKPLMTKYEKTKIIGVRAQQLASGSKPLIDVPPGLTDIIEIAERELNEQKTPFILKRIVGKKIEYWKLEDLEII
mgnify:CR=1 FL=1